MVREAVIVALANPTERANAALFAGPLPPGVTYLGAGTSLANFDVQELKEAPRRCCRRCWRRCPASSGEHRRRPLPLAPAPLDLTFLLVLKGPRPLRGHRLCQLPGARAV